MCECYRHLYGTFLSSFRLKAKLSGKGGSDPTPCPPRTRGGPAAPPQSATAVPAEEPAPTCRRHLQFIIHVGSFTRELALAEGTNGRVTTCIHHSNILGRLHCPEGLPLARSALPHPWQPELSTDSQVLLLPRVA